MEIINDYLKKITDLETYRNELLKNNNQNYITYKKYLDELDDLLLKKYQKIEKLLNEFKK